MTVMYILHELQVVLANGELIKTASRARKSSAGYITSFLEKEIFQHF
jgi:hypothetical protein